MELTTRIFLTLVILLFTSTCMLPSIYAYSRYVKSKFIDFGDFAYKVVGFQLAIILITGLIYIWNQ